LTTIAERLTDSESAELAAVQATVEALGWKDCSGTDTLQCGCGRIASADQFVSRRLAQGRGTRVTMCRQCAELDY
jgi:hypothetical protein